MTTSATTVSISFGIETNNAEAGPSTLPIDIQPFPPIQISIDAQLAEVLEYQGEKSLPFYYKASKAHSLDEKAQQNRFLTEWLESIFISGIASKKSLQKIIDNE